MTRDEIQKLIGGYATGTLTDSERKLLFDAALEDQELFDQLAQEQALKELLEEPGVKQRLIAALDPEPSKSVFWANRWPWAVAAVTASLAVVIGVAVLRTPEKPREIAAVTKQAEPPAPPLATPEGPPPVPQFAAGTEGRGNTSRPTAPKVTPAPPPAAASSDTPKAETSTANEPRLDQPKAEKTTQPSVDAIQEIAPAPALPPPPPVNGFVAGQTPQVPGLQGQPPPPPAPAPAGAVGGIAVVGGAAVRSADAAAGKGGPGGGGGGRGGGGKGGGVAGFAAQNRAKAVTPRFAFDYSFDADGALRITPATPGYLSVTVPTQPAPTVILPARNVAVGAPVIVPVPAGASELVVSFSATAAVTIGTPSRREEPTGTVEAQDQSQRILVTIPVKR